MKNSIPKDGYLVEMEITQGRWEGEGAGLPGILTTFYVSYKKGRFSFNDAKENCPLYQNQICLVE